MPPSTQRVQEYIAYSLCCLVVITAAITFVLSLYRLQRDTSLLNRERKRDYVTNKINKSFPTIAILISIIVCVSSILSFIALLIDIRIEILIISIVSNIILGLGLIVLGVIMLGFIENIVNNFPVDIERLLVEFILHNKTSARDELMRIENSNDCCTTQDPTWTRDYSKAAECNREEKHRMIYADQDEQRGCVKIIRHTALLMMPVLISEILCGCLCLLLGLWTIYLIYHRDDQYSNAPPSNDVASEVPGVQPDTKYAYYTARKSASPEMIVHDDPPTKHLPSYSVTRQSYPLVPFNMAEKPVFISRMSS